MAEAAPRPPPMLPSRPRGPPDQRRAMPELGPLRRAAGYGNVAGQDQRDNMWEVLHGRENSGSPQRVREDAALAPAAAVRTSSVPSRPAIADVLAGNVRSPIESNFRQDLHDLKADFLQPLRLEPSFALPQSLGWFERRLENAQAEQRSDIAQRWGAFEQSDRRFKDWVQRENEQVNSQLQQLKMTAANGQQDQQRQVANLTARCHKLELRVQDLDHELSQATTQAQGLTQALQAASSASIGTAAMSSGAPVPVQVESLRADLDREVAARAAQGVEAKTQLRELHSMLAQATANRQERSTQAHAAVAAQREGGERASQLETFRADLEDLREQLRRTEGQCALRCEEVKTACNQRVNSVQDAALAAAKELWEEHGGMVAECKSSMASLQQLLATKEKLAAQLQQVQQQQHQDDRHELMLQLQQGFQTLQGRVFEIEATVKGEQGARSEVQQLDSQIQRLSQELTSAQGAWLRDSGKLQTEILEARRQRDVAMIGDMRGKDTQLAETVRIMQRRLEELDSDATTSRAVAHIEERLAEVGRSHETGLREAEGRLGRQVADGFAIQEGKLAQFDFDLRANVRAILTEHSGGMRQELAKLVKEQAKLRGDLAAASEEAARLQGDLQKQHREACDHAGRIVHEARSAAEKQLAEAREELLRQVRQAEKSCADMAQEVEAIEARLGAADTALEARLQARLAEEMKRAQEKATEELQRRVEEERSARLQTEAERGEALQKRLGVHEELTTRRLDDLRARQEDNLATQRQVLEARLIQTSQEVRQLAEDTGKEQKDRAAADADLNESLKALTEDIAGLNLDLSKAGTQQSQIREEFWKEVTRIDAALIAAKAEELKAREAIAADLREAREDSDRAARGALRIAQECVKTESAAFDDRLREVRGELARAEEELQKRLKELSEVQRAHESATGGLQRQLEELDSRLQEAKDQAKDAAAEVSAKIDVATGALEKTLLEDMREVEERRLALVKRAEELEESLHREESRALSVEAMLTSALTKQEELGKTSNEALEELRAKMQETSEATRDEARRATTAEAALGDRIKKVGDDFETRLRKAGEDLHGEESRALAAESQLSKALTLLGDLGKTSKAAIEELQATSRDTSEALRNESQRARDVEGQLSARIEKRAEQDAMLAKVEGRVRQLGEDLRREEGRAQSKEAEMTSALAKHEERAAKDANDATENLQNLQKAFDELQQRYSKFEGGQFETNKLQSEVSADLDARAGSLEEKLKSMGTDLAQAHSTTAREGKHIAESLSDFRIQLEDLKQGGREFQTSQVDTNKLNSKAAADLDKRATELEEMLKKVVDDHTQERDTAKQDREAVLEKAKADGEGLESIRNALEELKQGSSQFQETQRDVNQIQTRFNTELEERLGKFLAEQAEKHTATTDEASKAGKELEQLREETSKAEGELVQLRKALEEREGKASKTEVELQEFRKALDEVRNDKTSKAGSELEQLRKDVEQANAKASADLLAKSNGLEEQLGTLEQKTADLVGKLEKCASLETVKKLRARVDGGLDALVVHMESEKWLRQGIDKTADTINNSFLRLVDESVSKLKDRVQGVEKKLSTG